RLQFLNPKADLGCVCSQALGVSAPSASGRSTVLDVELHRYAAIIRVLLTTAGLPPPAGPIATLAGAVFRQKIAPRSVSLLSAASDRRRRRGVAHRGYLFLTAVLLVEELPLLMRSEFCGGVSCGFFLSSGLRVLKSDDRRHPLHRRLPRDCWDCE